MFPQLTASEKRGEVVVSGDFRELFKCAERATRLARQFCSSGTAERWAVVKPMYEAASPHEKRRLGNITVSQAFAVVARRVRAAVQPLRGQSRSELRSCTSTPKHSLEQREGPRTGRRRPTRTT